MNENEITLYQVIETFMYLARDNARLASAMERVAAAFEKMNGMGAPEPQLSTPAPASAQAPSVAPAPTVAAQAAVQPPAPTVPAQAPAPAVNPVTTAVPAYTFEQLSRAGASLMDAGIDTASLFQRFGITRLTELDPARYGEFATALRQMGARI